MNADPDYLHIRFDTLDQAHGELVAHRNAAVNAIEDLKRSIGPLLRDRTGPAHDAYLLAVADWQKAVDHMDLVLSRATQALGGNHLMYRETERRNVGLWRG